jgi:hypothetical protein
MTVHLRHVDRIWRMIGDQDDGSYSNLTVNGILEHMVEKPGRSSLAKDVVLRILEVAEEATEMNCMK